MMISTTLAFNHFSVFGVMLYQVHGTRKLLKLGVGHYYNSHPLAFLHHHYVYAVIIAEKRVKTSCICNNLLSLSLANIHFIDNELPAKCTLDGLNSPLRNYLDFFCKKAN